MAFLGGEERIREYQERFKFLYGIIAIALSAISLRLIYLQIIQGSEMRLFSEENRIKRVKVEAPRGMVFDRNRVLLVDNQPAFDLEIIPQYLSESKQRTEVLKLLSSVSKIPLDEIQAALHKARGQPPFQPVVVKENLSRDLAAEIRTWQISLPGVEVAKKIKRTSVYGDVGAHLLGYIGEVTETDMNKLKTDPRGFKLGDKIGKYGLEQALDTQLRGVDGERLIEVDALGRIRRERSRGWTLPEVDEIPESPGHNLVLTIDQDLQMAAVKAIGTYSASAVAIDPRSGQVLAMVSRPGFDPTSFSRGISGALWSALLEQEDRPLGDKSIQDHYPPGSVFKVVTAVAGLEEGVITPHTKFNCPGKLRVGNRVFHCHKKEGHGELDVVGALFKSCDVFFYRVAQELKSVDQLAKWAKYLGLGARTGIPLPREVPGLIPTEAWKMARFKEAWSQGETLSVAIGQGALLTTTLQLANLFSSIANGGTYYRPYVIQQVERYDGKVVKVSTPEVLERHELKAETRQVIAQGTYEVVNNPGGTAYRTAYIPGAAFSGKTGTVQVIRLPPERLFQKCVTFPRKERHHGVFAGFAPADNPVIAVAVIGEHACSGSGFAAPVAKAIVETYFQKYLPERLKAKGKVAAAAEPVQVREDDTEVTPITDDQPEHGEPVTE